MNKSISEALYITAKKYFPGGVNSPVRAFKSVGGSPIFIERGDGAHIWDADGNTYIDFCCSWGPLILGHNNPKIRERIIATVANGTSFGAPTRLENELANLILSNHSYIEKIRFVSSGTEAVMSAIRLARAVTSRSKIIKFEGCYHGHVDALLVKAGSGLVTFGQSSSTGIPVGYTNETIVVPLNNKEAVEQAFEKYGSDIAAIIIEPIPANNGLLRVEKEFLTYLREITKKNESLLVFDEVISGFRVGLEGAAGLYDVAPDIITFGKIIGGGLPVGAYAASTFIMSHVAPEGAMYQAGTLSGNPVAMAAGIAQLTECSKKGFYEQLEQKTKKFTEIINTYAIANNYEFKIDSIGSIFWLCFSTEKIDNADAINPDMKRFNILYNYLLENGVYLGPSGYEVGFISAAHTEEQLQQAADTMKKGLEIVFSTQ